MGPLIITYVRHALPGRCEGDVTVLELLSCHDQWLIGDGCLSDWYRDCQKHDQRPVQNVEIFDLDTVMWMSPG